MYDTAPESTVAKLPMRSVQPTGASAWHGTPAAFVALQMPSKSAMRPFVT